jgi:transposase
MSASEKRDRSLHVGTADMSAAVEEANLSRTARLDPEVVERPIRRRFTAEFKRRVVEEAEACREPGDVGALLRRHALYSSHLVTWRRQWKAGALAGLTPRKRGRKAQPTNALTAQVAKLEREKARLEQRLKQAETIIEFQKKVSDLLGIPLRRPDNNGND